MLIQCSVGVQNYMNLLSLLFALVASKQFISLQILIFPFLDKFAGGGVDFHSPDRKHFLFTYLG